MRHSQVTRWNIVIITIGNLDIFPRSIILVFYYLLEVNLHNLLSIIVSLLNPFINHLLKEEYSLYTLSIYLLVKE
jgi:hypothetical protein